MRWIGPISDHERRRPRARASATLIPPTPMKRLREDVYALRFARDEGLGLVLVRSARSFVAWKRSSSALIALSGTVASCSRRRRRRRASRRRSAHDRRCDSRGGSERASARRRAAARSCRSPRSSRARAATGAKRISPSTRAQRRPRASSSRRSSWRGRGRPRRETRAGSAACSPASAASHRPPTGPGACRALPRARSPGRGTAVRAPRRATSSIAITRNATSSFVRTVAGVRATMRTSRLSIRGAPPSVAAISSSAHAPSEAVAPTDDTISHFPLIFCTLWSTPTTFATFPVFTSM